MGGFQQEFKYLLNFSTVQGINFILLTLIVKKKLNEKVKLNCISQGSITIEQVIGMGVNKAIVLDYGEIQCQMSKCFNGTGGMEVIVHHLGCIVNTIKD